MLNSWQQMKVLEQLIQHKVILQLLTSMPHYQEEKAPLFLATMFLFCFILSAGVVDEGLDQLCVVCVERLSAQEGAFSAAGQAPG